MIDYKLAKELKEAGFPEHYTNQWIRVGRICGLIEEEHHKKCKDWECNDIEQEFPDPTLSELIEAIGFPPDIFSHEITFKKLPYGTSGYKYEAYICCQDYGLVNGKVVQYDSPEESVARLWLALNK